MNNTRKKIIGSLIILFPILIGLFLWDQLPSTMAIHWGANNQADGFASKAVVVFLLPVILLGLHWLFFWLMSLDKRQQQQTEKVKNISYWIIPLLSLVTSSTVYSAALGSVELIPAAICVLLGITFIWIGNYMPKVTQNYHMGIKVIWALNDKENWNATHRFGGKVWFYGGFLMFLGVFLPVEKMLLILLPITLLIAACPAVYSWLYYKKQCREGRGYPLKSVYTDESDKKVGKVSAVSVALVLILVGMMMFTGSIDCSFNEESLLVEASFGYKLTVEYDSIDSVELREEEVPGARNFGIGSAKLLLGSFSNEEFGVYTRYTYTNSESAVIIRSGENVLVLSGKDDVATAKIYAELLSRIGN